MLEERSVVRADVIGFLVSVATPRALGQCWAVGRVANLPSSNLEDTWFPLLIRIDPSCDHVRNAEKEEEKESGVRPGNKQRR